MNATEPAHVRVPPTLDAVDARILREGRRWDDRLAAAAREARSRSGGETGRLPSSPVPPPSEPSGSGSARGSVAPAEAVRRWRASIDPDDAGLFATRLAWGGLGPADATRLFDPDAGAGASTGAGAGAGVDPAGGAPPDWWAELTRLRSAVTSTVTTAVTSAVTSTETSAVTSTVTSAPPSAPRAADVQGTDGAEPWLGTVESGLPAAARDVPFGHLLWPAVEDAWQRLAVDVPESALLAAPAAEATRLALLERLSAIATPALAARLAADRPVGTAFLLALGGPSPDAPRGRYAALCRDEARYGLTPLLTAHPVLGRLLAEAARSWARVVGTLCRRLSADQAELIRVYGAGAPISVVGLRLGAGDTHRGGQTVAILDLASKPPAAAPVRILFKPKDMRLEAAYHGLAAHLLDGPGAAPAVRVLAVGDAYGYASYVEHEPARDAAELAAFYRYAGRLLALLHLLGTTDAHRENLIAHGARLVLIDPETLFEGRLADPPAGVPTAAATDPADPAAGDPAAGDPASGDAGTAGGGGRDIMASVLRIGMLPSWQLDAAAARAVDISALGTEQSPTDGIMLRRGWVNPNTDVMAWGVRRMPAPTCAALPVARGEANPLADHADDVVAGFEEAYGTATDPRRRDDLLRRVRAFAGLRRRIVVRATQTYAAVLERGLQPERVVSADARGIDLDRLCRSALVADDPRVRWPLFLAEVHDLENLDIPYVDYPLGSRDLHGTDRVIPDGLAEDGLTQALARIETASDADRAFQVELIRAAIATRRFRMAEPPRSHPAESVMGAGYRAAAGGSDTRAPAVLTAAEPPEALPTPGSPAGPGLPADALAWILDGIERATLAGPDGGQSWLVLQPIGDGLQIQLRLMDDGLYSGRAGLAAFLGELADSAARTPAQRPGSPPEAAPAWPVAGGPPAQGPDVADRADMLARRAWQGIAAAVVDCPPYAAYRHLRDLGLGLTGAGGLLRALGLPSRRLPDDTAAAIEDAVVDALLKGVLEQDVLLDLMGGAAGIVRPLAALAVRRPDERILAALRRTADLLVDRQTRAPGSEGDGGWITPVAPRPLTGLTHGASGLALALLDAAVATGDERYRDASGRGFAFERRLLDRAAGNWPDRRRDPAAGGFMVAWCHGATGIGLARSRALALDPANPAAAQWREDLAIAVRTTIGAPPRPLDHLCCGNAGRAALLGFLGQQHGDAAALAASKAITLDVLDHWRTTGGFRLADLATGTTIGQGALMTGLAGIGLHLLPPRGRASVWPELLS